MGRNEIIDLSALSNLTGLNGLDLYNNDIHDIGALSNLKNLTGLGLGNNRISDISVIENLTNITHMNLEGNEISDISMLENLSKLYLLNLNNNDVADISALENLTELTELFLSGNPVTDYTYVDHVKSVEGRSSSEQTFSPGEQIQNMDSEISPDDWSMVSELYGELSDGNMKNATALVNEQSYDALVEGMQGELPIIIPMQDEYIAIYPDGNVYVGSMNNGIREGDGLWFYGDSDEKRNLYYDGEWRDDKPNGEGVVVDTRDGSFIDMEEGTSYALVTREYGTFKDGFYDGAFEWIWNMNEGTTLVWNPNYEDGVAQRLESDGDEYIIAYNDTGGSLTGSANPQIVFGFEESTSG